MEYAPHAPPHARPASALPPTASPAFLYSPSKPTTPASPPALPLNSSQHVYPANILVTVVPIKPTVAVLACMDFIYLANNASSNVSMGFILLLRMGLGFAMPA
jgi:hypothetical protein